MSLSLQQPLPGIDLPRREPSPMELLAELARRTDDPTVAVAVSKSVVELTQSMERFNWEREERQSKIDFDEALNRVQGQIGRIKPNQRRENNIEWLDYAGLDKVLRPLYAPEKFAITFSEIEGPEAGRLWMKATLSRSGISKEYVKSIPNSPANGKMSQADGEASAASRVKRYLMLQIFNIAVGIDAEEKAPYEAKPEDLLDESVVLEFIAAIEGSNSVEQLKANYQAATKAGMKDPSALRAFDKAKKTTWQKRGFHA